MRQDLLRYSCCAGLLLLACSCAVAQTSVIEPSSGPSLGDIAKQQRDKQKAKSAETPSKVVTNEDIPESDSADTSDEDSMDDPGAKPLGSRSGEQWAAEIAAKKKAVENLESQMNRLNASIHFTSPTCVRNCVQHNERQEQKQEQVERMRQQLADQKQELEEMQEAARKEGFGNSVYEP